MNKLTADQRGETRIMQTEGSKLLNPELTEKIIGVYYDVYNEIGHGFLESVYSNCMQIFKRLVFENANKKIRVHPRVSAVGIT